MIGSKTPRHIFFVLALGIAAAGVMLAMFYFQYRWLAGEFALADAAEHEAVLRGTYVWVGAGTAAVLLLCLAIAWFSVRRQTARINDLRIQAEKLRDADFGEPLPQSRDDALGELASVFNDMRDRLKSTTISRDYMDSILSGMNEAIIVTSADGTITRINRATTILLGFEDNELIGASIDFIVNRKKSGTLVEEGPSGVPREAFFESKFGDSIPVSYTCSFVAGEERAGEEENEDRGCAAFDHDVFSRFRAVDDGTVRC